MPAEPLDLSELKPHRHRQVAESFGANAERYDRTRPRYPRELVERILAGSPGREVLDAGCGTGIAARLFQEAGCQVLGVEPDERMAAFARATGVEVEVARIETWNPAGRMFDALVAGQAWHWVEPDEGAAKAAEVLRAGGRVAVFWNVAEEPPEVTATLTTIFEQVLPDLPHLRQWANPATDTFEKMVDAACAGFDRSGAFEPSERWQLGWERTISRDEWIDGLPTSGVLSQLPRARLDHLSTELAAALDGDIPTTYRVLVATAVRTG